VVIIHINCSNIRILVLSPHSVCIGYVQLSHPAPKIFLHSINGLVCVMMIQCFAALESCDNHKKIIINTIVINDYYYYYYYYYYYCRPSFKQLRILPLPSQYIFSLLLFVIANKKFFLLNSQIHSIHTRHNDNLHLPQKWFNVGSERCSIFRVQNLQPSSITH
jgi:hypothetical protein